MLKVRQDKVAALNPSLLKGEDEDDAQTVISTTVPGSSASIAVSQLTSPASSPTRRGTAGMGTVEDVRRAAARSSSNATIPGVVGIDDARRAAGRTGSNAAIPGVGGIEEVPTTTGGDYDEDDRMGLLRGEKDGTTTPPFPGGGTQGGRGAAPTVDELALPFGRAWRQRQQQQQQQQYVREATLKPNRAQLGIRHHVVAADVRDIQRMEEGKNLVHERARYAMRRLQMSEKIKPSEIRFVGKAAYDVHFLRDDTELWHRRMMEERRARGLARMLCCA